MSATITTNNHVRPMVAYYELPAGELETFDYVPEDGRYDERFVCYRGEWHDVHDSVRIDVAPEHTPFGHNVAADSPLASWHSVATDSVWTATVFKLATDKYGDDGVIVGSYVAD